MTSTILKVCKGHRAGLLVKLILKKDQRNTHTHTHTLMYGGDAVQDHGQKLVYFYMSSGRTAGPRKLRYSGVESLLCQLVINTDK